ncbi:MAG: gluconate 5-dehydrogenase [Betaproteobacteria bacterium RIFCSPLOWO2_12_FULL_62_13]|nr:MAG: gluconate 5-dehydrogenase [Betaproteobacteria bacterium RIFCSPLOWO2_12_FULL_62_13]
MATIKQLFDLSGRVSIITGGSAGLGLQMATGLAEAGSNLVICSRNRERCEQAARILRAIGPEVLATACDVSKPDQVERLKDEVLSRFGRVDVLINNAGRTWWASPEETPLDKWQYVIDLNVTGTFLCSQIFGRQMIKQKRGKIINIASASGLRGKNPEVHNSIAYNTTKGAVINMTRDLAVKWAPHNILVNAIAPGFFLASRNQGRFEERKDKILEEIPLGRSGGENDLKGAAVFLASDASDFVTGAILSVDGGATAW